VIRHDAGWTKKSLFIEEAFLLPTTQCVHCGIDQTPIKLR